MCKVKEKMKNYISLFDYEEAKTLIEEIETPSFEYKVKKAALYKQLSKNDIADKLLIAGSGPDELEYVPSEITLDLSGKASEKTAGARMKKYELDASATNDGKLQSNDIVLFRYADVLLMKSEAKVRNGGNGDAELTEVRERAGATLDVTATLETLLEERLREFAWEGLRRQDLVRFGKFTRAYTDRPQLPKEDTGYTTVFPIHEDVLSLNGKLTQNYGY